MLNKKIPRAIRMKQLIRKAKTDLKDRGVTATHLIVPSAEQLLQHMQIPGTKHAVNLESDICKYVGNLFGMDVYVNEVIPKDAAYMLDFSVLKHKIEEKDFIKAYNITLMNPKSYCEIHVAGALRLK